MILAGLDVAVETSIPRTSTLSRLPGSVFDCSSRCSRTLCQSSFILIMIHRCFHEEYALHLTAYVISIQFNVCIIHHGSSCEPVVKWSPIRQHLSGIDTLPRVGVELRLASSVTKHGCNELDERLESLSLPYSISVSTSVIVTSIYRIY